MINPPSPTVEEVVGHLRHMADALDTPRFGEVSKLVLIAADLLSSEHTRAEKAESVEHRVCDGCGTSMSGADIAEAGALACCPERKMLTAKESSIRAEVAEARAVKAEKSTEAAKLREQLALALTWQADEKREAAEARANALEGELEALFEKLSGYPKALRLGSELFGVVKCDSAARQLARLAEHCAALLPETKASDHE